MAGTETAIDLICRHEGYAARIYTDNDGSETIGYGQHLSSLSPVQLDYVNAHCGGEAGLRSVGINEPDAKALVGLKIAEIEHWALINVEGYASMPDAAQAVLIDMTYNMGTTGIERWPHFLAMMAQGKWVEAALLLQNSLLAKELPTRVRENSLMLKSLIPKSSKWF